MAEPQHLISIKAALQAKRAPQYHRLLRWMWFFVLGGIASGMILLLFINFTAIPSFRELEDPNSATASEALANNNEVLGRYFIENRVPVAYEKLNQNLVNALIAKEDERFREHCGIDSRAVLRVIFRTILGGDQSAGGGSTITQQLAKMLYSDRDFRGMGKVQKTMKLVYIKLREWITAVKLERSYTKEEILALYLNQFDFINNAVGIHSAAEVYYGKDQKDLRTEEAATLVGMLQNPAYFNPVSHPERNIRVRMVVLWQMRKKGYISEEQYNAIKVKPLGLNFKKVSFTDDKAPYVCSELKKDIKAILEMPESRRSDGSTYNLYKDGLKIYTTIDPVYQKHAEAAMAAHMAKTQRRFFDVWRNRDPWAYRSSETTDGEIAGRKESFWSMVRGGERYTLLRTKYLDLLGEKIQEKFNFELRDIDIIRMLDEEKKSGSIAKLMAKNYATAEQALAYRQIMGSTEWPGLKQQWRSLQTATELQYKTKVKMKVFSWGSPGYEKADTIMSPWDSLRYHRMFLQSGVLAVDPTTSEIKAWVGGINFKYFQFDHTRTARQVGSTFKPFVYSTAIAQQGISPCFQVYDNAVTIHPGDGSFGLASDWTPRNSTGIYSGAHLTLKEALKNSVNSVSAYLMKQMGTTEPVRGLLNNMGVDSTAKRPDGQYRMPQQPAICLGAADLSVYEMTGAYATFANKGMFGKPFVIRKIEDKNGRVIYRSIPEERAALAPNVTYVMLDMLKYNVKGAPGINALKSEVGGKTGTTNDFTDGWFMGITPRLVVGTWVGGDDRWIRFLNIGDGQGAKMARPIFADFIQRLEKDPASGYDFNARFQRPPGELGIEINCSAYLNGPAPTGDEEDFAPDIYNDEVPLDEEGNPKTTPKGGAAKKPDEGFGDEHEGN